MLFNLEASLFALFAAAFNMPAMIAQFIIAYPIIIEEGLNIVHGRLCDIVERFLGQEGLVGSYDHVGH